MLHPLDGCWAKIDRANHHIENLESEIAAFFDAHPYRVAGAARRVSAGSDRKSVVQGKRAVNFGGSAVEVINHLRSSLDHLIWALAIKQVGTPPNPRIQLPIYKNGIS